MSDTCSTENDYDGREGLRILSVFVIMGFSGVGTFFPLLSSNYSSINLPNWCWFIAKFFGSGVIISTGFIHLLQPASEALTNDCLTGWVVEYPWAFGICLISLFTLFLVEIIVHNYMDHNQSYDALPGSSGTNDYELEHINHDKYIDLESNSSESNYLNNILSIFILEFGVIFHSIFIGLSLAVSGEEFTTLFIVLTFHQMFEGLGLGTRIAEVSWDETRRKTPWILALGFTITTPISIIIGLMVRNSFNPQSRIGLITNGVFDSISAGILIYTGIVELMAHEFLYSNQFKGPRGFKKMLKAYVIMCLGAGLMALLGRWA